MGNAPTKVMSFDEALATVLAEAKQASAPKVERSGLLASRGRVLAEEVKADRDQPPFDRSTRDGFAVRAGGSAELRLIGQVRAGEVWRGLPVGQSEAVEIMTGAPVPDGADAVVMVEHTARTGDRVQLQAGRALRAGENVVLRGAEARVGDVVLGAGTTIGAAEIALAAACGCSALSVYERPKVAIVTTGDELVELTEMPEAWQIRNSNSYAIAAMVEAAGGEAMQMRVAPDRREALAEIVRDAAGADLMVLSGGVSMGEYDVVEEVLTDLGATFFFTGVKMQPGKPVVFGRFGSQGQYFFGLPGNPVSTQVTFHCFVEPLLRAMGGGGEAGPRFVQATLAEEVEGKTGLTRVLPGHLTMDRVKPEVRVVGWQGSGDLGANARANCYVVLPEETKGFEVGAVVTVLLR